MRGLWGRKARGYVCPWTCHLERYRLPRKCIAKDEMPKKRTPKPGSWQIKDLNLHQTACFFDGRVSSMPFKSQWAQIK